MAKSMDVWKAWQHAIDRYRGWTIFGIVPEYATFIVRQNTICRLIGPAESRDATEEELAQLRAAASEGRLQLEARWIGRRFTSPPQIVWPIDKKKRSP